MPTHQKFSSYAPGKWVAMLLIVWFSATVLITSRLPVYVHTLHTVGVITDA